MDGNIEFDLSVTPKRRAHGYRGLGSISFKLGTTSDLRNLRIGDIELRSMAAERLAELVYKMFVR